MEAYVCGALALLVLTSICTALHIALRCQVCKHVAQQTSQTFVCTAQHLGTVHMWHSAHIEDPVHLCCRDCGLACALMVLKSLGVSYLNMASLRSLCSTTR